jgi:Mycothiol maleylpyruvate isomerase N-terminal domain
MGGVIDAGDVVTTRDLVLAFLTPLAARDCAAPVPDLEWNCEMTLRHMIRAQTMYAAHLATRATQRLAMSRELDPGLSIDALLDNLRAQVSVLAAVIRDARPEARAWHNSGMTDPTGYCAMSCDELLVHTWDIGPGSVSRSSCPLPCARGWCRGCSRYGRRSMLTPRCAPLVQRADRVARPPQAERGLGMVVATSRGVGRERPGRVERLATHRFRHGEGQRQPRPGSRIFGVLGLPCERMFGIMFAYAKPSERMSADASRNCPRKSTRQRPPWSN